MLRSILVFGAIAGAIVVAPMFYFMATTEPGEMPAASHAWGYLIMLVALSVIFLALKRRRDRDLGGVIKFLPALLMGLAISAVAGLIYTIGWEIVLAVTGGEFMQAYTAQAIEAERAKGVSEQDLARFIANMEEMQALYAQPWFRLPITFIEIFPVGVLVSLISALLLRNPRFLPARHGA